MNQHLIYRGQSWDPAVGSVADPDRANAYECKSIQGLYRGQSYSWQIVGTLPVHNGPFDLRYRGVSVYDALAHGQIEAAVEADALSMVAFAGLGIPADLRQQLSTIHHENVMYRLQQRIQSARERGDLELIHQLELEGQQG
ncbi:MAG: DUF4278 domain-containing protein [Synechococcaceae cyanobacterium SM2_3_2]|nr:DUF4278 domain-containing protein [Synechococcaceae cyanobacterium SM2_3_2]